MKLQKFNGGLATRLAPQLLNIDQGVIYENIDNSSGILKPVKDKKQTDIEVKKYNKYFNSENEWIGFDTPTDFIEFQKVMYLTDRINKPLKYSNNEYNLLGIEEPKLGCNVESIKSAEPLEDITVLNTIASGDLPASDFDYLLFNVNEGVYSTPFKFTVYSSTTTDTRAQGEVVNINSTSRFGRNPITTEDTLTDRAIQFKNLEGKFSTSARLYRFHEGDWRLVHEFLDKNETYLDDVFDISNRELLDTNKISPFNGVYQYVYTYYNVNDGTESAPSVLSGEIEINSGYLKITLPSTSNDSQVTNKRLYRIGGNVTQFTLVEELDSTVTEFIDNLSDISLDGRLLQSDNYYAAPAGLKYLSETYAMLFGSIDSSLRFTPIGLPNAWPPEYEIQFESEITGLGPVSNGLLVFTRTKTYIVTGTGPTSLAQQPLRGDQGCIAFESIAEASEGTLIWASEDGLCTSSGNNVQNITKGYLGAIELEPISSVVNDEVYYCHNKDGTTLAWDYRFNTIPKNLNLGVDTLSVALGVLYGNYNNKLYEIYKNNNNNLTMKYKSPRFVEGSFTLSKTYKKFYIRSEGDIIIKIIIDNKIVSEHKLNTTDTHQLQIPQIEQRGYSVQFYIEGTGTVDEIEYVSELRQNA